MPIYAAASRSPRRVLSLAWSFEDERERVQARVEFFTKCVVNQALTRHAREALKSARVHGKMIVGFPAGTRARMAGV
jgi:hypothetical protein